MKKAEKTSKSAESAQQNLPGDASPAVTRQDSPAELLSAGPAHAERVASLTASTTTATTSDASASISSASAAPVSDDAHQRSLERTHELVSLHALRVRESGNDTLRVVIEPGGGTRLALELRWSNDGIQAQAQLQRGDFDFLSGHWAELQQRLEPRGIHLAALGTSGQFTPDNNQFKQPHRQPSGEEPAKSAFADFAFGGSMTEAPATRRARAKTHTGFETWA